MIQAKIFDSIINDNKSLANEIFINKRDQLDKIISKSRLKNLFLELLELDNNEKKEFNELKKSTLIRNQIIISDILYLSKKFRKFNIHHVFIKGAATLFQIKYSKALRYTSDIDVLIDIKDISKLHVMFKTIGIEHSFDIHHDYINSKKNHTLESIKLNSGIFLDIHFRSSSPLDYIICPYTKEFLKEYDVINEIGTYVNVLKMNHIYIFSQYQLFGRKEINNCSSSIIDLILIKKNYGDQIANESSSLFKNLKIREFSYNWKALSKFDSYKLDKFKKKFVKNIFSDPQIQLSRRLKVIFLNVIYLRRAFKEKYGLTNKIRKI